MSEYQHERFPGQELDGATVGVVVAKRTYVIGDDRVTRPSAEPEPVRFTDVLVEGDDPLASPVRLESDAVVRKERSDVVIQGVAYAPGGHAVPVFDVEVVVGRHRRLLQVSGPRQAIYRGPANPNLKEPVRALPLFTDPAPVLRVPVTPANAYGGSARFRLPGAEDVLDIPCSANPFGKGYCVQNSPEGVDGVSLPQIEDPSALLTPGTLVRELGAPEAVPALGTLGVYGRAWYPRSAYSGVPPHEVDRVRAQVRAQADALDPLADADAIEMLRDFQPPVLAAPFFQCASPGLALPYLSGDEAITLRNLTPSGLLSFNLPGRVPLVHLDLGDGLRAVAMILDTVVFDAETGRLELTFRGRVPLGAPDAVEPFLAGPIEVRDVDLVEARRAFA